MEHTIKESEEALTYINANSKIKFIDSSWFNDACDSVVATDYDLRVWFPNPCEVEPEYYRDYVVQIDSISDSEPLFTTKDLGELVTWLNGYEVTKLNADLITAFNEYREAHNNLVRAITESEMDVQKYYPFSQSFDEINVNSWVDQCIENAMFKNLKGY